ncbi:MAG: hypothetical protein ABI811_04555 [Acidobacteriota bacterium]
MPHLRLEVPEEWLREEYKQTTGFDPHKLLDHLVNVVAGLRMPSAANPAEMVPLINKSNLKHGIVPLHYAHMAGDPNKRFIHVTLAAGNDTPGRTAAVRLHASQVLGEEIDTFLAQFPAVLAGIGSITMWVQDIDRDRGYSTLQERKKKRDSQQG